MESCQIEGNERKARTTKEGNGREGTKEPLEGSITFSFCEIFLDYQVGRFDPYDQFGQCRIESRDTGNDQWVAKFVLSGFLLASSFDVSDEFPFYSLYSLFFPDDFDWSEDDDEWDVQ